MLFHDLDMCQELLIHEKQAGSAASCRTQQPPASEKLQRLGRVIEQEFQADQIEKHRDGPGKAVVRFSAFPFAVFNRDLTDQSPGPACQGGNETMRLAIQW